MAENILAGVLLLLVVSAGIWCWWIENGKTGDEAAKDPEDGKKDAKKDAEK